MSVPTFAFQKMHQMKVPTAHTFVECQSKEQFGEMALVINGKDYVLKPEEWMFDPQTLSLAQGGNTMEFNMNPLGPQLLAQVDEKPLESIAEVEGGE